MTAGNTARGNPPRRQTTARPAARSASDEERERQREQRESAHARAEPSRAEPSRAERMMCEREGMRNCEVNSHVRPMVLVDEEEIGWPWCFAGISIDAHRQRNLFAALDARLYTYIVDCVPEGIVPLCDAIS